MKEADKKESQPAAPLLSEVRAPDFERHPTNLSG
jgi:hypothetical protein